MSRFFVRPIQEQDADDLLALAKAAGPGFTTLPPQPEFLQKKV